jgi:outer membrane scaffolding protein for murein synthesis (MipA/OmpV family)
MQSARMSKRTRRFVAGLVLAHAIGITSARAADDARNWELSLGAGVAQVPDYSGAHSGSARLWAWADGTYRTEGFGTLVLDSGSLTIAPEARWDFVDSKSAGIGALVGYRPGRGDQDPKTFRGNDGSTSLRGLPPVGSAIDTGIAGHATILGVPWFAQIRSALSGAQGTLVNLGVYLPFEPASRVEMSLVPTLTWSNARQMRALYGVSHESSAASGFAAYEPASGWENAAIELATDWRFADKWHLLASVAYERLLDGAARSPVVQSVNQPKALVGLAVDF